MPKKQVKAKKVARDDQDNAQNDVHMQNQLDQSADDCDLLSMNIPEMPAFITDLSAEGERLFISHLTVENFKSYYGKHVLGPFHKNFTAIIGANGSGKSNVIDSMLFVFGYRASKIRSKKLSVLIHSSSGRDNISSCSVTVHFQKIVDGNNREDFTEFPDSKFTVSRTAFRDNSSRYAINGRTAQFSEVGVLLRKNGVDLVHNRFLILQGEVEQISLMKPKAQNDNEEGMLEYMEDIIGSSRLKEPIFMLQTRLEKIDEQRSNQFQRVRHAEKERAEMDEPVSKEISRMRLENAINSVRNKIISFKKLIFLDQMNEHVENKNKLEEELNDCQTKLKEIEQNAKQQASEQSKLQKKLDVCHELLQDIIKQINSNKQGVTKLKNDKRRFESKYDELEIDLGIQKDQLKKWQEAPEKALKSIELYKMELDEALKSHEECMLKIEEKLPESEVQTAALRKSERELREKLDMLLPNENNLNSNLVLAQEKMVNFGRNEAAEKKKLAGFREKLTDITQKLSFKEKEFNSANGCLPKVRANADEKTEKFRQCKVQEVELVGQIKDYRSEFEEKRQMAEAFKSNNRLLDALMKEKEEGRIPGIFGRLGDLGAIEQKYDVAISTTCGALNNIVVTNPDVATECIKFLKREKLGVGVFIALDKQQNFWSSIRNTPHTPENSPRLIDLIRVKDEQMLPAFYFALRDTLVVDDIKAAHRVAFGGGRRWRTVTLKGELIETSGSITGGGNQQKRGLIGRSVRVDTTAERVDDRKRLDELDRLIKKTDSDLLECRRQIAQLENDFQQGRVEIQRLENLVRESGRDAENFRAQMGNLTEQIQHQEACVAEATPNPAEVRRVQEEIKKCTEGINSIHDSIVGNFIRKRDDAKKKCEELETAVNRERATIEKSKREVSKTKAKIADMESDAQEAQKKLANTIEDIRKREERIGEFENEQKARQTAVEEVERSLKEFIELNKNKNTEEVNLSKRLSELNRELKSVQADVFQIKGKFKAVKDELSKLKLYRLEDFSDLIEVSEESFVSLLNETRAPDNDGVGNEDSSSEDDGNEKQLLSKKKSLMVPADGLDEFIEEGDSDGDEELAEEKNGEELRSSRSRQDNVATKDLRDTNVHFKMVKKYGAEQVRTFNIDELKQQLVSLEQQQKPEAINLGLIIDYRQKVQRYRAELEHLDAIITQRDLYRVHLDRFKKCRLHEFMEGYRKIASAVKEIYQMLTLQGDADMDLVDSLDPFSEGISFSVRPPKKSWKQIGYLSGGEKTLASLALVFGLHTFRPSPFYVMDEIDAALDFRNVSIISIYILERTLNSQFIVISLRNQMFERADRIVGIYKVYDCTRHVVLDPSAVDRQCKEDRDAVDKFGPVEEEDELNQTDCGDEIQLD